MANFKDANLAAILSACRLARWLQPEVDDTEDPPVSAGGGISSDGAVYGVFGFACRAVPGRRTAWVEITSFDAADEYTVTHDGTAVTTSSGPYADADAALTQLQSDIDADGTVGPDTDTTLLDADGNDASVSGEPAVKLQIRASSSYGASSFTFDASLSGGAGTIAATVDADSATIDVYANPGGQAATAPDTWCKVRGLDGLSVDTDNLIDVFRLASIARFDVRVTALAKNGGDGASVTAVGRKLLGTMTKADAP